MKTSPSPPLAKRGKASCIHLLLRWVGALSDIYTWKNEIIVCSRIPVNPLFLVVGS